MRQKLFDMLTYIYMQIIDPCLIKFSSYWTYHHFQKLFGFPRVRLEFRKVNGYWPNLNTPKSFNEKVLYRKLYDYSPLLSIITDKYEVREYVTKSIGEQYLIPLLQVADSVEELNFESLPNEFAIKLNIASGFNKIVRNKREVSSSEISKLCFRWMQKVEKNGYKRHNWFYQGVPKKILIEKLIIDCEGNVPVDYKFYVFDGEVKFIHVDFDRFGEASRTFYDPDWNRLPFSKRVKSVKSIPKPINLQEMISVSRKLAEGFSFMRVDLYDCSNIFFGELTPFPAGGFSKFYPPHVDFEIGKLWTI